MSSFNGITIVVLADGIPRKSPADITVRHIPGGGTSYIDVAGAHLKVLDLALYFPRAIDAVAFESQIGVAATLVVPDGTYAALLSNLIRTTRGLSTTGDSVLQAEFYI